MIISPILSGHQNRRRSQTITSDESTAISSSDESDVPNDFPVKSKETVYIASFEWDIIFSISHCFRQNLLGLWIILLHKRCTLDPVYEIMGFLFKM